MQQKRISSSSASASSATLRSTSSPSSFPTKVDGSINTLEKPLLDDRLFQQFILPNGILVTTVSDHRSEKSSCALAVKIGAAADNLPGLAHITEHAVFLGSQKYPIENEYKKMLNKNGGGSNGGTSMEQTIYKFYVNAPAFPQTLDIFSQFFKSPLLDCEAISREINAVDAEDSKNRILEARRFLQILKHQIHPQTNYIKFSTGNLRTLSFNNITKYGVQLSEKIQRFHQSYYQPNEMAVCLIGPQSLEELKKLAYEHFADIKSFDVSITKQLKDAESKSVLSKETPPIITTKPDTTSSQSNNNLVNAETFSIASIFKNFQSQLIRIKPIRDIRDLTILWPLPYSKFKYKQNPCHLLSHILSYKGEGSLFSYLQDQRYATALSASIRTHFPGFTLFEVSVSLTKEGLTDYQRIIEAVYGYLNLISSKVHEGEHSLTRREGDELHRIWEEMKAIRKINFLFEEKSSPYETSPELAENMLDYPLEEIMSIGRILTDFPREELKDYVSQILSIDHPNLIILRSKEFDSLPNDEIYKIDEFIKLFEESLIESHHHTIEEIEQWKENGDYFHHFRLWLDTWQQQQRNSANTTNSFIEYEPYYGTPYEIQAIDLSQFKQLSPDKQNVFPFHLPKVNSFISYDLLKYENTSTNKGGLGETLLEERPSIESEQSNLQEKEIDDWNISEKKDKTGIAQKPLQSAPPKVLAAYDKASNQIEKFEILQSKEPSSGAIRNVLWYSKDEIFETPKSAVFFLFKTPASDEIHPVSSLITTIFDQMTVKKYYDSAVAGLGYSFSLGQRGLGLRCVGYSSKLAELGDVVSEDILNYPSIWEKIDPQLFQDIKEKQLRGLQSWFKDRPDSQANSILSYLIFENAVLPAEKIQLLEKTDLRFLQQRIQSILQTVTSHIAYVHGDLPESQALQFYETIIKKFHANNNLQQLEEYGKDNSFDIEPEKLRKIPEGIHHQIALPPFNVDDPNNAYILYLQTEQRTPTVLAKLLILRKLLSEPAFNILRTQKQLGYIVSLSSADFGRGLRSIGGIELKVLSKRFSPIAIEKEVETFFHLQYDHLMKNVTEEDLHNLKQSIITTIKDPMNSLLEEGYYYYSQILNEFPFNWKDQIIEELQRSDGGVQVKDIQEFFEQYIYAPSDHLLVEEGKGVRSLKKSLAVMIFSQEKISEYEDLVTHGNHSSEISHEAQATFLNSPTITIGSLSDLAKFRSRLSYY